MYNFLSNNCYMHVTVICIYVLYYIYIVEWKIIIILITLLLIYIYRILSETSITQLLNAFY